MVSLNDVAEVRSRSGPDGEFRGLSGERYGEVTEKEKAEAGAPTLGCQVETVSVRISCHGI
jgi:hypothetical protein